MQDDLPTGLWVEAKLRDLTQSCIPYYIIQKGNHASGIVMVKINNMSGQCTLMTQQRNFSNNKLEWVNALHDPPIDEKEADDYISRAIKRDPDLWVIDIEDQSMQNPFLEGKTA